jgi:hypothetical protein
LRIKGRLLLVDGLPPVHKDGVLDIGRR